MLIKTDSRTVIIMGWAVERWEKLIKGWKPLVIGE